MSAKAAPPASRMAGQMAERVQKALAQRGLGSRRAMEDWIRAGRVAINGRTARLGERVSAEDCISVDGRPLPVLAPARPRVLVMNKAEGVICTRRDPEGRPDVFEGLPRLRHGRWLSVGRLDINSGGLLMLTNDGALAHRLMHPATGIDREYAVRINGALDDEAVERLRTGIRVDGETQRFSDVRHYDGRGANHWYHVVLMEGRNREVRRLFAGLDRKVTRLKRVRYGPVTLPAWLRRGKVCEMGPEDLESLYRLLRLPFTPAPRRTKTGRPAKRSLLLPYPELPALQEREGG